MANLIIVTQQRHVITLFVVYTPRRHYVSHYVEFLAQFQNESFITLWSTHSRVLFVQIISGQILPTLCVVHSDGRGCHVPVNGSHIFENEPCLWHSFN